ncbi:hypothetical protein LdCL_360052700 [Leishmania donovani]|uniref:Uncharacterized protein n=1 Tax=Leishmania donovani TaxID=5661 RepID=A0A3Q8IPF2_LEIDO|nr:hypothetical protein LdCL_360052700 [Leishmania donovani]
MSSYDAMSAVSSNGAAVPEINLHPRLMTYRPDSDSYTSSARQTPRSSRAVPTNAELAYAGVTAQDGVVQQLSSRSEERGSLAGPREVSAQSNSGHRVLRAITACGPIDEPLQFSQPQQRRAVRDTPREQKPQQHQSQLTRNISHGVVTRNPTGAVSSREPIRPGRSSRSSTPRIPSKYNDPYAHVTSVVQEYRQSRISALEAQYRVVRTHSNTSISQGYDTRQSQSASPRSAEARHNASAHRRPSARPRDESRRVSSASSRTRQNSPLPRAMEEEYLRGGVPRAALDAPHIRYAEALQNMYNYSSSAQRLACMSSMSSNMTTEYVPDVARRIPDRFKYVPPTEEERRHHREATLRALEEWRRRQWAGQNASCDEDMAAGGAAVEPRNRNLAKNQAGTRSQQPQPARWAPSASYAPRESQLQQASHEKAAAWALQKEFGNTSDSFSGQTRDSFTPSKKHSAKKASKIRGAAEQHDDYSTNEGAGEWERLQSSVGKRSGTPISRRQNGAGSRASSRKGRKSPPESARLEDGMKLNSFRQKLLFDIVAPTVSIA